jgi:hypothetical protein
MPLAPNNVHRVYQLNWGMFCTLTKLDIVSICTFSCLVKHVFLITYLLLVCAGDQSQQTSIIIVNNALVGERIRGWCSVLKARCGKGYIALVTKYYYYMLRFCLVDVRSLVACSLLLPLSYPKKEVGEPKKEIRNLNGQHMNSYDL